MNSTTRFPDRFAGLTAIWRGDDMGQIDWIRSILGGAINEWIFDQERTVVLNDSIVFDRYVNAQDRHMYEAFRGKNAFLVDLADENYDFRPEVYSNFRGVIRCYGSDVFRPDFVRILPLGYFEPMSFPINVETPVAARRYIWSFMGEVGRSSRPEMAANLLSLEPHLLFSTGGQHGFNFWNTDAGKRRRFSPQQCLEILADSVFAPCPMGNVNLECWRVYEALECGAIPVLEKRSSLDYFHELFGDHPIPTFSSWKAARSAMCDFMLDSEQLNKLQQECRTWWAAYQPRLADDLQKFLRERSSVMKEVSESDVVFPRFYSPAWQYRELLRHHSAGASLRRVYLQIQRVVGQRRLRIAHGGATPP